MAKSRSKKADRSVGVDIGSHSIKVSVMGGARDNPILEAYNVKKIIPKTEKIELAKETKEALGEIDVKTDSVNIAVFGPDVIVRFITLPKMTKEHLDAALIFEAEKYIPFNVRDVVLDSLVMGGAQDPGQMKVLLAAAKKAPIEAIVNAFKDLAIQVNFVDISAFSGFNAFMFSSEATEKSVSALLEIGHSQTSLLISVDGVPVFVRQIQTGGRDIDLLVSRSLSVTPEQASEFRNGVGVFDKDVVDTCMKKVIDGVIREIQLSFGYFEGTCNRPVEGIYCSGGMTYAPGVLDYLSDRMGVKVTKWDPLRGIRTADNISRVDIDSVSACLPVSIGLAIRR